MAENAEKKVSEVTEKASDVAKNIWLAGLGAYGKAFDEAQIRYEKVSKETSRLFDDLVAKGKKLENETSEKITEAKDKSSSGIEERLSKVRQSLGFGGSSSLEQLTEKVDELSAKLDLLIESLEAKPKAKPSRASAAKKED